MARVIGQIESLKRLRIELDQKGISRFNSIGEINSFLKYYEFEKNSVYSKVEEEFDGEIESLHGEKLSFEEAYESKKLREIDDLTITIEQVASKIDMLESKNVFLKLLNLTKRKYWKRRKERLEKNFDKIISERVFGLSHKIYTIKTALNNYTTNRDQIISERSSKRIDEINHQKEVIDSLYPLISGAIGENLVANELKVLSDNFYAFNDFSVEFDTPIYNRKENDRIFSIQIDHLLVTNAGIFILETKNWSEKSIKRFDLRSPIEQIKRCSYALFVLLNSNSDKNNIELNKHHWGDKQIPIRNVIVMINNKPKEKFKFVEIKTVNELNSYISFFDPIFEDSEVQNIAEVLYNLNFGTKNISGFSFDGITLNDSFNNN